MALLKDLVNDGTYFWCDDVAQFDFSGLQPTCYNIETGEDIALDSQERSFLSRVCELQTEKNYHEKEMDHLEYLREKKEHGDLDPWGYDELELYQLESGYSDPFFLSDGDIQELFELAEFSVGNANSESEREFEFRIRFFDNGEDIGFSGSAETLCKDESGAEIECNLIECLDDALDLQEKISEERESNTITFIVERIK